MALEKQGGAGDTGTGAEMCLGVSDQVYLELSVEVSKSWRENKQSLEKYGYFDAMYT